MSAEHETAQHGISAGEYIAHHLTFFNGTGAKQQQLIDWSLINYDTLFYSTSLGVLACFVFASIKPVHFESGAT